jgi:hypothetical protein
MIAPIREEVVAGRTSPHPVRRVKRRDQGKEELLRVVLQEPGQGPPRHTEALPTQRPEFSGLTAYRPTRHKPLLARLCAYPLELARTV